MEDEIEDITITTTLDTDDKQYNWIKIPDLNVYKK